MHKRQTVSGQGDGGTDLLHGFDSLTCWDFRSISEVCFTTTPDFLPGSGFSPSSSLSPKPFCGLAPNICVSSRRIKLRDMHPWKLSIITGCGIWHAACGYARGPQPGDGSAGMRTVVSTVPATAAPNFSFAPLPTPRLLLMDDELDLRKRQDPYFGDICGYVSGNPSSPFGCGASSRQKECVMSECGGY